MRRLVRKGLLPLSLPLILLLVSLASTGHRISYAQIPTGSIPTVTGSPLGAYIVVLSNPEGFINVRAGPSRIIYEVVGVMVRGQQAPALGRNLSGDWIQVAYPGTEGGIAWVSKELVDLRGSVPVVDAPPTPTPRVTPTLDPTLAAEFLVEVQPTRLPTFTPPPMLSIPTFTPDPASQPGIRLPIGMIILSLAIVGLFGLLISFLRGR